MQEILKRIDELINICDRMCYSTDYQKVVFEIDELIISLVGKDNDIYKNYLSVYNTKSLSTSERGNFLVGILNGLKSHLKICAQNKKYQIFVSSTYLDLIDYRKCVADEIAFMGQIAIGMEDFTACGEDLDAYIKREIDQSDYYVLLIGQRYGSTVSQDENMSFTMMEYYYAKSTNKRIIPFIYNGSVALPNNDLDINRDKLNKFIGEVKKSAPQYFKNEIELGRNLIKALESEFRNHPQKGLVRL